MADFHEILMPTDISVGAVGSWMGFNTAVREKESGHEKRRRLRQETIGEWDIIHGVRTQSQLDALAAFYVNRFGMAFGFRFKDWFDYQMARQVIGQTDGSTTDFQIYKNYIDSAGFTYQRQIYKILLNATSCWVNGVSISPGAATNQFQVNINTGILTIGTALAVQSGTDVEVALSEFHEPVRFMTDLPRITVIRKELYDLPFMIRTVKDYI